MNPSTVHNFKGEINSIKKIQFLFGQAVVEGAGGGEAKCHLFILSKCCLPVRATHNNC